MSARGRFTVVVPTSPRPKQRARMTKAGRAYTPKETVVAEAWVRMCCVNQVGTPRVPGPIALHYVLVMPIPKGMPRHLRAHAIAGRHLPTSKPDWDNLAKLFCDALNGVAWGDDAHVVAPRGIKVYGDEPRTLITWWQMTPEECALEAGLLGALAPLDAARALL